MSFAPIKTGNRRRSPNLSQQEKTGCQLSRAVCDLLGREKTHMASARFLEILKCRGVDQDATPHPGMIVPFQGENQVVLETYGMDVQVHSSIKFQEFNGRDLTLE